ncbi:hypothetical protein CSUI_003714 [Cystoisospora suis]|uniref:Uncharacterized protein n=1 Tax=Cystoisospora suis TaxID=483139 RepID=A0A2C6KZT3_9APIC|nr:hypothetical protein CSUI_003714 [Cystoisospora suis]
MPPDTLAEPSSSSASSLSSEGELRNRKSFVSSSLSSPPSSSSSPPFSTSSFSSSLASHPKANIPHKKHIPSSSSPSSSPSSSSSSSLCERLRPLWVVEEVLRQVKKRPRPKEVREEEEEEEKNGEAIQLSFSPRSSSLLARLLARCVSLTSSPSSLLVLPPLPSSSFSHSSFASSVSISSTRDEEKEGSCPLLSFSSPSVIHPTHGRFHASQLSSLLDMIEEDLRLLTRVILRSSHDMSFLLRHLQFSSFVGSIINHSIPSSFSSSCSLLSSQVDEEEERVGDLRGWCLLEEILQGLNLLLSQTSFFLTSSSSPLSVSSSPSSSLSLSSKLVKTSAALLRVVLSVISRRFFSLHRRRRRRRGKNEERRRKKEEREEENDMFMHTDEREKETEEGEESPYRQERREKRRSKEDREKNNNGKDRSDKILSQQDEDEEKMRSLVIFRDISFNGILSLFSLCCTSLELLLSSCQRASESPRLVLDALCQINLSLSSSSFSSSSSLSSVKQIRKRGRGIEEEGKEEDREGEQEEEREREASVWRCRKKVAGMCEEDLDTANNPLMWDIFYVVGCAYTFRNFSFQEEERRSDDSSQGKEEEEEREKEADEEHAKLERKKRRKEKEEEEDGSVSSRREEIRELLIEEREEKTLVYEDEEKLFSLGSSEKPTDSCNFLSFKKMPYEDKKKKTIEKEKKKWMESLVLVARRLKMMGREFCDLLLLLPRSAGGLCVSHSLFLQGVCTLVKSDLKSILQDQTTKKNKKKNENKSFSKDGRGAGGGGGQERLGNLHDFVQSQSRIHEKELFHCMQKETFEILTMKRKKRENLETQRESGEDADDLYADSEEDEGDRLDGRERDKMKTQGEKRKGRGEIPFYDALIKKQKRSRHGGDESEVYVHRILACLRYVMNQSVQEEKEAKEEDEEEEDSDSFSLPFHCPLLLHSSSPLEILRDFAVSSPCSQCIQRIQAKPHIHHLYQNERSSSSSCSSPYFFPLLRLAACSSLGSRYFVSVGVLTLFPFFATSLLTRVIHVTTTKSSSSSFALPSGEEAEDQRDTQNERSREAIYRTSSLLTKEETSLAHDSQGHRNDPAEGGEIDKRTRHESKKEKGIGGDLPSSLSYHQQESHEEDPISSRQNISFGAFLLLLEVSQDLLLSPKKLSFNLLSKTRKMKKATETNTDKKRRPADDEVSPLHAHHPGDEEESTSPSPVSLIEAWSRRQGCLFLDELRIQALVLLWDFVSLSSPPLLSLRDDRFHLQQNSLSFFARFLLVSIHRILSRGEDRLSRHFQALSDSSQLKPSSSSSDLSSSFSLSSSSSFVVCHGIFFLSEIRQLRCMWRGLRLLVQHSPRVLVEEHLLSFIFSLMSREYQLLPFFSSPSSSSLSCIDSSSLPISHPSSLPLPSTFSSPSSSSSILSSLSRSLGGEQEGDLREKEVCLSPPCDVLLDFIFSAFSGLNDIPGLLAYLERWVREENFLQITIPQEDLHESQQTEKPRGRHPEQVTEEGERERRTRRRRRRDFLLSPVVLERISNLVILTRRQGQSFDKNSNSSYLSSLRQTSSHLHLSTVPTPQIPQVGNLFLNLLIQEISTCKRNREMSPLTLLPVQTHPNSGVEDQQNEEEKQRKKKKREEKEKRLSSPSSFSSLEEAHRIETCTYLSNRKVSRREEKEREEPLMIDRVNLCISILLFSSFLEGLQELRQPLTSYDKKKAERLEALLPSLTSLWLRSDHYLSLLFSHTVWLKDDLYHSSQERKIKKKIKKKMKMNLSFPASLFPSLSPCLHKRDRMKKLSLEGAREEKQEEEEEKKKKREESFDHGGWLEILQYYSVGRLLVSLGKYLLLLRSTECPSSEQSAACHLLHGKETEIKEKNEAKSKEKSQKEERNRDAHVSSSSSSSALSQERESHHERNEEEEEEEYEEVIFSLFLSIVEEEGEELGRDSSSLCSSSCLSLRRREKEKRLTYLLSFYALHELHYFLRCRQEEEEAKKEEEETEGEDPERKKRKGIFRKGNRNDPSSSSSFNSHLSLLSGGEKREKTFNREITSDDSSMRGLFGNEISSSSLLPLPPSFFFFPSSSSSGSRSSSFFSRFEKRFLSRVQGLRLELAIDAGITFLILVDSHSSPKKEDKILLQIAGEISTCLLLLLSSFHSSVSPSSSSLSYERISSLSFQIDAFCSGKTPDLSMEHRQELLSYLPLLLRYSLSFSSPPSLRTPHSPSLLHMSLSSLDLSSSSSLSRNACLFSSPCIYSSFYLHSSPACFSRLLLSIIHRAILYPFDQRVHIHDTGRSTPSDCRLFLIDSLKISSLSSRSSSISSIVPSSSSLRHSLSLDVCTACLSPPIVLSTDFYEIREFQPFLLLSLALAMERERRSLEKSLGAFMKLYCGEGHMATERRRSLSHSIKGREREEGKYEGVRRDCRGETEEKEDRLKEEMKKKELVEENEELEETIKQEKKKKKKKIVKEVTERKKKRREGRYQQEEEEEERIGIVSDENEEEEEDHEEEEVYTLAERRKRRREETEKREEEEEALSGKLNEKTVLSLIHGMLLNLLELKRLTDFLLSQVSREYLSLSSFSSSYSPSLSHLFFSSSSSPLASGRCFSHISSNSRLRQPSYFTEEEEEEREIESQSCERGERSPFSAGEKLERELWRSLHAVLKLRLFFLLQIDDLLPFIEALPSRNRDISHTKKMGREDPVNATCRDIEKDEELGTSLFSPLSLSFSLLFSSISLVQKNLMQSYLHVCQCLFAVHTPELLFSTSPSYTFSYRGERTPVLSSSLSSSSSSSSVDELIGLIVGIVKAQSEREQEGEVLSPSPREKEDEEREGMKTEKESQDTSVGSTGRGNERRRRVMDLPRIDLWVKRDIITGKTEILRSGEDEENERRGRRGTEKIEKEEEELIPEWCPDFLLFLSGVSSLHHELSYSLCMTKKKERKDPEEKKEENKTMPQTERPVFPSYPPKRFLKSLLLRLILSPSSSSASLLSTHTSRSEEIEEEEEEEKEEKEGEDEEMSEKREEGEGEEEEEVCDGCLVRMIAHTLASQFYSSSSFVFSSPVVEKERRNKTREDEEEGEKENTKESCLSHSSLDASLSSSSSRHVCMFILRLLLHLSSRIPPSLFFFSSSRSEEESKSNLSSSSLQKDQVTSLRSGGACDGKKFPRSLLSLTRDKKREEEEEEDEVKRKKKRKETACGSFFSESRSVCMLSLDIVACLAELVSPQLILRSLHLHLRILRGSSFSSSSFSSQFMRPRLSRDVPEIDSERKDQDKKREICFARKEKNVLREAGEKQHAYTTSIVSSEGQGQNRDEEKDFETKKKKHKERKEKEEKEIRDTREKSKGCISFSTKLLSLLVWSYQYHPFSSSSPLLSSTTACTSSRCTYSRANRREGSYPLSHPRIHRPTHIANTKTFLKNTPTTEELPSSSSFSSSSSFGRLSAASLHLQTPQDENNSRSLIALERFSSFFVSPSFFSPFSQDSFFASSDLGEEEEESRSMDSLFSSLFLLLSDLAETDDLIDYDTCIVKRGLIDSLSRAVFLFSTNWSSAARYDVSRYEKSSPSHLLSRRTRKSPESPATHNMQKRKKKEKDQMEREESSEEEEEEKTDEEEEEERELDVPEEEEGEDQGGEKGKEKKKREDSLLSLQAMKRRQELWCMRTERLVDLLLLLREREIESLLYRKQRRRRKERKENFCVQNEEEEDYDEGFLFSTPYEESSTPSERCWIGLLQNLPSSLLFSIFFHFQRRTSSFSSFSSFSSLSLPLSSSSSLLLHETLSTFSSSPTCATSSLSSSSSFFHPLVFLSVILHAVNAVFSQRQDIIRCLRYSFSSETTSWKGLSSLSKNERSSSSSSSHFFVLLRLFFGTLQSPHIVYLLQTSFFSPRVRHTTSPSSSSSSFQRLFSGNEEEVQRSSSSSPVWMEIAKEKVSGGAAEQEERGGGEEGGIMFLKGLSQATSALATIGMRLSEEALRRRQRRAGGDEKEKGRKISASFSAGRFKILESIGMTIAQTARIFVDLLKNLSELENVSSLLHEPLQEEEEEKGFLDEEKEERKRSSLHRFFSHEAIIQLHTLILLITAYPDLQKSLLSQYFFPLSLDLLLLIPSLPIQFSENGEALDRLTGCFEKLSDWVVAGWGNFTRKRESRRILLLLSAEILHIRHQLHLLSMISSTSPSSSSSLGSSPGVCTPGEERRGVHDGDLGGRLAKKMKETRELSMQNALSPATVKKKMKRRRREKEENIKRCASLLEKRLLLSTLHACLQGGLGGSTEGENDIEVNCLLATLSSPRIRSEFILAIQQYLKVYKFKGKA